MTKIGELENGQPDPCFDCKGNNCNICGLVADYDQYEPPVKT